MPLELRTKRGNPSGSQGLSESSDDHTPRRRLQKHQCLHSDKTRPLCQCPPLCFLYPLLRLKHPKMDVVIIRENEEDLYTGIEYRHTPDVTAAIKIISRQGTEKIIRYAFEYAKRFGRKKVTCFTKDNILKMTDGLFHKIFDEIGEEFKEIEKEHWIVDIGAAKLADTPEAFDVIVLPNLYGDILSDVAAQISGSVGLVGSANIGEHGAMFEAIHGSAPKRGGQNVANPSAMILASVYMLVHIHQPEVASLIHNAWLSTMEKGIHTYDVFDEKISSKKVGTKEFGEAVIQNLGKKPETLKPITYEMKGKIELPPHSTHLTKTKRELMGVDIFIYSHDPVEKIAKKLLEHTKLPLNLISNRGVTVWPEGFPETSCIEEWRCRLLSKDRISPKDVSHLIHTLTEAGIEIY